VEPLRRSHQTKRLLKGFFIGKMKVALSKLHRNIDDDVFRLPRGQSSIKPEGSLERR